MAHTVIWSDRATLEFEQAIEYLRSDSPIAAAKLRLDLLDSIAALEFNPESGARFERRTSGAVREIYCHPYRVI